MFGGSQNYGHTGSEPMESRPAKRPRNISGPEDHGYREAAVGGQLSEFREGQMPPPPVQAPATEAHPSPRATGTGKGRGETDKNNRKLSCKECRRCVSRTVRPLTMSFNEVV
jgi:hypothetical protein